MGAQRLPGPGLGTGGDDAEGVNTTAPNGYGRKEAPILRIDFPIVYISIDQRKVVMVPLVEETV